MKRKIPVAIATFLSVLFISGCSSSPASFTGEPEKIYSYVDLDLSDGSMYTLLSGTTGTVSYDSSTELILNNIEQIAIPLPEKITAGETVPVKITGINNGVNGFRSWLVDENYTTNSDLNKDFTPSGFSYTTGNFDVSFQLTATASADYLLLKGPKYGTPIDNVTITSIKIKTLSSEGMTITGDTEVAADSSTTLRAKIESGNITDTVKWSVTSGDDYIYATVSDDGKTCSITGIKEGSAVIKAAAGKTSATFRMKVIASQTTDAGNYCGTWAASPYLTESGNMPPIDLDNNTLRQIIHVSVGGSRIRLKFSNRCGDSELAMNSVHLALSQTGGNAIDTSTDKAITFNGNESVTVAAGSSVISDIIDYNLTALSKMAITIYFGDVPSDLTGHPGSRTTSYITKGNEVSDEKLTSVYTAKHWYVISGLDIYSENTHKAIVCFGDSITDGHGTTTDAQNRWTDFLAEHLQENTATQNISVLNEGIGGTLVTSSGIGRFDRDVLGQNGVKYIVMLYGVNDILFGGANATTITSAYKQLIVKAHNQNILIYGGTIMPFGDYSYYTAAREEVRQTVNSWIRTTASEDGGFDGYIDFDAALRDPGDETKMLAVYKTDGLHPNPAGYEKMGNIIDPSFFR